MHCQKLPKPARQVPPEAPQQSRQGRTPAGLIPVYDPQKLCRAGYDEEKGGGGRKPGRGGWPPRDDLSPSNSQQLEAVLDSSASVDGAPGGGGGGGSLGKPRCGPLRCLELGLACCGACPAVPECLLLLAAVLHAGCSSSWGK